MLSLPLVIWLAAVAVPSLAPAPAHPDGAQPSGRQGEVIAGTSVELLPHPPFGALEAGLGGEAGRFYATAISAIRGGQHRRALTAARQARVICYQTLRGGSGLAPVSRQLASRHFSRALYLEEQLSEITLIEEQLERPPERSEQRSLLLQLRALLLHNLFLAVRGFSGVSDSRLLTQSIRAYQAAIEDADTLKHSLIVGYAAMLAERGQRHEARAAFAKLSEHEREQETMDIAVAYYYLALGDRSRSIARLLEAARRDSWLRGSPGREGHSFRSQVYRMNDFDRLRDHPRFIELVTTPEEQ